MTSLPYLSFYLSQLAPPYFKPIPLSQTFIVAFKSIPLHSIISLSHLTYTGGRKGLNILPDLTSQVKDLHKLPTVSRVESLPTPVKALDQLMY